MDFYPIDDGISNGNGYWMKLEIEQGTENLADLSGIVIYNKMDSGEYFRFGNTYIDHYDANGQRLLDGDAANGASNGFASCLEWDDSSIKGNNGYNLRTAYFMMANGDNASFFPVDPDIKANKALAPLGTSDHFVLQWSFDNGSNWVTATNKFWLSSATGAPPSNGTAIRQDKSYWTELTTAGVIAGSEMPAGYNWYAMPIPTDQTNSLATFKMRLAVDAASEGMGVAIDTITLDLNRSTGLSVNYDDPTDAMMIRSNDPQQDIRFVARSKSDESDWNTWLMYDASKEHTYMAGNSDITEDEGILKIYNTNGSINTGDVTVRIQHNEATTDNANYWIGFFTDDNLVGGIDSEVAYDTFTGCHPTSIAEDQIDSTVKGMILKSTGDVFYRQENSISNAWVTTEPTTQLKDKAVVGVYNKPGSWGSGDIPSPNGKQLYMYNALGEGQVLVTDEGGNLEAGDYICSSSRKGHGMKQDDDLLHNYTVAKATESINWEEVEVDEDLGYKSTLVACTYHCG